jgi:hypothetical protein
LGGHRRIQFWPGLRLRVKRLSNVRLFLTFGILPGFGFPSSLGVCDRTFPALVTGGSQLEADLLTPVGRHFLGSILLGKPYPLE